MIPASTVARAVLKAHRESILAEDGPNLFGCLGETPVLAWTADLFGAENTCPRNPSPSTVRRLLEQHGCDSIVLVFPFGDNDDPSFNAIVRQPCGTTSFGVDKIEDEEPVLTQIGWIFRGAFVAKCLNEYAPLFSPFTRVITSTVTAWAATPVTAASAA